MAGYQDGEWLSDFDGREYGIGVVRGTRSFNVDDADGTLTGVYYRAPWEPGENKALCFAEGSLDSYPFDSKMARGWIWGGKTIPLSEVPWPEKHSMNHCACGFYAYYNGSNDYYSAYSAPISGVVEGYGETVIGTKGFRTRKARIVALCIPGRISDAAPRAKWWKYTAWSRATHLKVGIGALAVLAGILIATIVNAINHGPGIFFFPPLLTAPLGYIATSSMLHSVFTHRHPAELSDKDIAKVRAKYLNIPIYNSFEDMIAAFPPDHEALKQVERKK